METMEEKSETRSWFTSFNPTMELRWNKGRHIYSESDGGRELEESTVTLQQKWINKLGQEDWRDIPMNDEDFV